jgi:hypothetical protein
MVCANRFVFTHRGRVALSNSERASEQLGCVAAAMAAISSNISGGYANDMEGENKGQDIHEAPVRPSVVPDSTEVQSRHADTALMIIL